MARTRIHVLTENHTPLKIEDLGRKSPASDPSPPLCGADGETRTLTAFATAPSRRRVYQFHHVGVIGLEASPCRKRARPQSARFYYFGTSFAFDFAASDAFAASALGGDEVISNPTLTVGKAGAAPTGHR